MARVKEMRFTLTASLVVALAGCGGTPPVARRAPFGPAIYTLSVEHRSEMSASFRLVGLTVRAGSQVVFERNVDTPDGDGDAEIVTPICDYRGTVPAGTHALDVELVYRGRGSGVFSYLRGYRFRVRSAHDADVSTNDSGLRVISFGHEQGVATAPLEERPAVRWLDEPMSSAGGCHPLGGG
jgi:hypothetical protein